jgi:hypothetical protein
MSCYGYVTDMFRKSLKSARTSADIKVALNFYFEACDDLKIPIETQWYCIGIIFDRFRKGEL